MIIKLLAIIFLRFNCYLTQELLYDDWIYSRDLYSPLHTGLKITNRRKADDAPPIPDIIDTNGDGPIFVVNGQPEDQTNVVDLTGGGTIRIQIPQGIGQIDLREILQLAGIGNIRDLNDLGQIQVITGNGAIIPWDPSQPIPADATQVIIHSGGGIPPPPPPPPPGPVVAGNQVCGPPVNVATGYWTIPVANEPEFQETRIAIIQKFNPIVNTELPLNYPDPKKYPAINEILQLLPVNQYAYWMIKSNLLTLVVDTYVRSKGMFIVHGMLIKYVKEVPLDLAPVGVIYINQAGVEIFEIAEVIPSVINNQQVYFVIYYNGQVVIYEQSKLPDPNGPLIVIAGGITVTVVKVNYMPENGFLDPKLNYTFVPIVWTEIDRQRSQCQGKTANGVVYHFTLVTTEDPDFTVAFIKSVPITVKMDSDQNGIIDPNGVLVPVQIVVQVIILPDNSTVNGYWILIKGGYQFVVVTEKEVPGSFYIVIKGERILVIRSTTVERLSGYFIETADGPQFRGTSISRASVGGMKGYWVLIDGQLQFAQRSPLSVRNGYYLRFNGKQIYVHYMDVKPTGKWITGKQGQTEFVQAEIKNFTIGILSGVFLITRRKIEMYTLTEKSSNFSTLLVINGVNRPANLMPIDISADGYFLFQEPNEILFVESEITPAYVNDTDGYWISVNGELKQYVPGDPLINKGIWIVTNGRLNFVFTTVVSKPEDFQRIQIKDITAYIIYKDGSRIVVEEAKRKDESTFTINTISGKKLVKPVLYNGIVRVDPINPQILTTEEAIIQRAKINGLPGYVIQTPKEQIYGQEVREGQASLQIIYNGGLIYIAPINPIDISIVTELESGREVTYKIVPDGTPGAIKKVINGKQVSVVKQNE